MLNLESTCQISNIKLPQPGLWPHCDQGDVLFNNGLQRSCQSRPIGVLALVSKIKHPSVGTLTEHATLHYGEGMPNLTISYIYYNIYYLYFSLPRPYNINDT